MKRRLSSLSTHFQKWLIPPLFGGAAILLLVQIFGAPGEISLSDLFATVICGSVALFASWYSLKIKNVSVDERVLYVSNYVGEVAVPLSEVRRAEFIRIAPNCRHIVIHLAAPGKFGDRIYFVPPSGSFMGSEEPQVLVELKEQLTQYNGAMTSHRPPNKSPQPARAR